MRWLTIALIPVVGGVGVGVLWKPKYEELKKLRGQIRELHQEVERNNNRLRAAKRPRKNDEGGKQPTEEELLAMTKTTTLEDAFVALSVKEEKA